MPVSITPDSFVLKGRAVIPVVGMGCRGLAFHPSSGTFFTIGQSGKDLFNLYQFKLDVSNWKCSIVKKWGFLNSNNILGISGQQLVMATGLLWDNRRNELLLNFGSYYASSVNNPFLASFSLESGLPKLVSGPHSVPLAIHSDTVKGGIAFAPEPIYWETGCRLLASTRRGSMSQKQSWGTGFVAIERPSPGQSPSVLSAESVVHWPMKSLSPSVYVSDFPHDQKDESIWIENGVTHPMLTYGQADAVYCSTQIDNSILSFGAQSWGYSWYNKHDAYSTWPSRIFPGQSVKPTTGNSGTGLYSEAFKPKLYLTSIDSIISSIRSGDKQVAPYLIGDIESLGGNLILNSHEMSGLHFDPESRLLYSINMGTGSGSTSVPLLVVWRLKP